MPWFPDFVSAVELALGRLVQVGAELGERLQLAEVGQVQPQAARHLLQRSIPAEQVVAECWEQYRHRSPQDAQAISADPGSGPQLRAALAQPALAGYKGLSELIAERRASAKGLAHTRSSAPDRSTAAPKSILEEARIA